MLRAFGHRVATCWVLLAQVWKWSNLGQQHPTRRNTVAKRTQHVAPNNFAICCVDMLRSFGRGLRRSFSKVLLNSWQSKVIISNSGSSAFYFLRKILEDNLLQQLGIEAYCHEQSLIYSPRETASITDLFMWELPLGRQHVHVRANVECKWRYFLNLKSLVINFEWNVGKSR